MNQNNPYLKGFRPYALAAFLTGLVGGFSTVLGPAFVQDLGIDYTNTTWTALAQAMSTAACAPILGKTGDLIGRQRTLFLGIAVFTLGNLLSALADSLVFMLAARFTVGIGAAAMTPVIIAYILTRFPANQISRGFSLYMLISSASVIFGPALGGLVIAAYGWRRMLWICTAICLLTFAFCLLLAEKEGFRREKQEPFDSTGAVLILIFFSLLLCIPAFGQNFGWSSPQFLAVLAAAALSLAGLYTAEKKAAKPILPGDFMKRRSFVLSMLAMFLTQGLMQANMTNLIVFVNSTLPENTTVSGYAISILYLGMSLGAVFIGPLADRFEAKSVLTGSFLLTGSSCALLLLFSEETPVFLLVAALGLLGLGLGGNGTIFMKVTLSGLSPEEAGSGTSTYGLFRDLAAPFGVAVFVPLFTNRISSLTAGGLVPEAAAVSAIHTLALAELLCIAAGTAAVRFLPDTRKA